MMTCSWCLPIPTIHPRKGGSSSWADPIALQRLTKELARYIGPIAEIVVKRTEPGCDSLEDLCLKVAQEIESQPEREKFLASFRS